MTATQYERRGNKQFCARHETLFGRAESCAGCVADPGTASADEPDEVEPPPEGCLATLAIEREFVAEAKFLGDLALRLIAKSRSSKRRVMDGADDPDADEEPVLDTHLCNSIAKLSEGKVKCLRAAAELACRREDDAIVARDKREKRELDRGAAH